jgi:phage antirepressor YoqD-like protein
MNNLMSSNEITMSSREIAELTGKQLCHIHRDFKVMSVELEFDTNQFNRLLMPNPDLDQGFYYDQDDQGRIKTIHLNRELTLTLISGYSIKLRNSIIKRWQELENNQHKIPQTYGEALQLAANQAVQIEDQQKQIESQAPAVEFVDNYTKAESGSKGFRETAKLLSIKENVFRKFLVDSKIMYRLGGTWVAYQTHIDCGRFEMITGESNGHIHNLTKFTAKGITWIAGEYAKSKVEESK